MMDSFDLSSVSSISIPEGTVTRISVDGVTIWEVPVPLLTKFEPKIALAPTGDIQILNYEELNDIVGFDKRVQVGLVMKRHSCSSFFTTGKYGLPVGYSCSWNHIHEMKHEVDINYFYDSYTGIIVGSNMALKYLAPEETGYCFSSNINRMHHYVFIGVMVRLSKLDYSKHSQYSVRTSTIDEPVLIDGYTMDDHIV